MPMMRMPFTRKFPNKADQPAGENPQEQTENTGDNTNVNTAQGEMVVDMEQKQGENVEQKNNNPAGGEGEDKGGKKVK